MRTKSIRKELFLFLFLLSPASLHGTSSAFTSFFWSEGVKVIGAVNIGLATSIPLAFFFQKFFVTLLRDVRHYILFLPNWRVLAREGLLFPFRYVNIEVVVNFVYCLLRDLQKAIFSVTRTNPTDTFNVISTPFYRQFFNLLFALLLCFNYTPHGALCKVFLLKNFHEMPLYFMGLNAKP